MIAYAACADYLGACENWQVLRMVSLCQLYEKL
jgi:hypothetical protein